MQSAVSDDDFLSALSFHDAPASHASPSHASPSPVRAPSYSPTLRSMVSDGAGYPTDYPSSFYGVPAPSSSTAPAVRGVNYRYGTWQHPGQHRESASAVFFNAGGGGASTERSAAAVSAAEKERQILELEMGRTEEQRRRLEARLSAARRNAERQSREPSATVRDDSPMTTAGDAAGGAAEVEAERGVTSPAAAQPRSVSAEASPPPPWSPSPPLAHKQETRRGEERRSRLEPPRADGDPHSHTNKHKSPETAAGGCGSGVEISVVAEQSSPSPSPSRVLALDATEANPASQPAARLSVSASPNRVSHTSKAVPRLSPSPQRTQKKSRGGPTRTPLSRRSPHRTETAEVWKGGGGGGVAGSAVEEDEAEERFYAAYQRKLARIQQALRESLRPTYAPPQLAVAEAEVSRASRLAYEQRRRVRTPALAAQAAGGSGAVFPAGGPPYSMAATHAEAGRLPLVRRAPSVGASDVGAAATHGHRPPPQLRFHLQHSGNVVVSPDGFACRTDAAEAIALIEREYAERIAEVLPRLVIPFYALGNRGITSGSLLYAFRWTSPSRHRSAGGTGDRTGAVRAPALAFGFATRGFAGYGSDTPAFLYLSSGLIAQGVRGSRLASGAERPYGAPYAPGLELAARLDLDCGELEFFVQSVSMGVAFRFCPARHPAPLFPVVVFSAEGDTAELLYSV